MDSPVRAGRAGKLLPAAAIIAGTALGASSGLFIKGLEVSSFALSGFRMAVPLTWNMVAGVILVIGASFRAAVPRRAA